MSLTSRLFLHNSVPPSTGDILQNNNNNNCNNNNNKVTNTITKSTSRAVSAKRNNKTIEKIRQNKTKE